MRILIVTREYSDVTPYSGGIGTTFAVLAPELAAQGHEIHVLAITDGRTRQIERDGVHFHLLKTPIPRHRLHPLEETLWTAKVDRAIRRLGRFDTIFTPEWGAECLAYMSRRDRSAGPVVVQLTSSLAQLRRLMPGMELTVGWKLRWAVQRHLEHAQAKRADAILASTHAILAWARQLWEIESIPTTVVPNLLRVDRVRELALASELPDGWPEHDGPVVAFSGRLEIRKGVHILTEAMKGVWAEWPDAHVVFMGTDSRYGDGMMSEHVRRVAATHADHVHLLGNQPPGRLFAGLKAADIVALPSLWENFASAALEAMAVGTSPVLTLGSGFQEFVRDEQDGLLVEPDNAAALAAALIRLLDDPQLRARLGASAIKKANEYDAPVMSRRYVEFFEQVAGRSA